jgi:hypothetical protein
MNRGLSFLANRRHNSADIRNNSIMRSSFPRFARIPRRGLGLLGLALALGFVTVSSHSAPAQFSVISAMEALTPTTVPPLFVPDPNPPPETRRVLQPVLRYQNVTEPQGNGRQRIDQKMNPFLSYTNLGTDFGFIGAGEGGLGWEVGPGG